MTPAAHHVVVVGSITTDVTTFSGRLPVPGETILGDDLSLVLGGKGANQALAAARAGARTAMVGCVGDDLFRDLVLTGLREGGVDTSAVTTTSGPTGVAHIRVNSRTGQNDIVMVRLANAKLTSEVVERELRQDAGPGDVLLLQLEIPVETAVHAARVGRELGMTVLLDPAPAPADSLPEELLPLLDVVTPNESEAGVLTGTTVVDVETAGRAGAWFVERGVRHGVITLAERGVLDVTSAGAAHHPAPRVDVVDTTAAGDAFAGVLGAAAASGLEWEVALQRAIHAGALAVTRRGASPSLPTPDEVTALIASTEGTS